MLDSVSVEFIIGMISIVSVLFGFIGYILRLLNKIQKHIDTSIRFENDIKGAMNCVLRYIRDSYNYNGLSSDLSSKERNERLTSVRRSEHILNQ